MSSQRAALTSDASLHLGDLSGCAITSLFGGSSWAEEDCGGKGLERADGQLIL